MPPTTNDEFWTTTESQRLTAVTDHVVQASNADITSTRQYMDNELLSLERYRLSILTHKNLLAPVSRIPPEIMAAIFALVAPLLDSRLELERTYNMGPFQDHVEQDRARELEDIRSLISASQACSRWRDIALRCATLWANVWHENPWWGQEMLKRARSVPLQFFSIHSSGTDASIRKIISSHTFRRLCAPIDDTDLGDALSRPAPWLEIAHLALGALRTTDPCIPSHLFFRNAPRLRCLRIEGDLGYGELLQSPILHNLSRLELYSEHTRAPIPSISHLLDALKQMPRLQVLALEDVLPPQPLQLQASTSASENIVQLPHLIHLSLRGLSGGCVNLAQNIVAHPDCRLEYYICHNGDVDLCLPTATIPPLINVVPGFSSIPMRALWMDLESCMAEPYIACWNVGFSCLGSSFDTDMNNGKKFGAQYSDYGDTGDAYHREEVDYDIVTRICDHLRLDCVEDLRVNQRLRITMSRFGFWPRLLRRLPRLERLILGAASSLKILELIGNPSAFSAHIAIEQQAEEDVPLVPLLFCVCLPNWGFHPSNPIPERLLDCLRGLSSRVGGLPLRELHIVNCRITAAQVASFESVAESVIWDGITGGDYACITYNPDFDSDEDEDDDD
ncbi:uncharacterized protein STEHIDRAFT_162354 [Stereum hirsutum FP-91666 SS1]|uniref:uncharacterized protein n=1 Tax=Stereum hirsutum (strain FP-91666) TaxID=721885 RepID=UPI0004449CA2|nr:uncharacterized protein STEHIDRAFT_162354 [Stereum hirsutum FP-91666 SS1]EIM80574.1 hypothetical protein STEHIDRAFT_162354 [Stereum hirsutum FP-91666 SS1]